MYFGGRKRRLCPSFRFKRCQAPSVLTRALALGSAGAKPHRTSLLPWLQETPNATGRARQGLDGIHPPRRSWIQAEPSWGGFGRESCKDKPHAMTGAGSSRPGTSRVWFLLRIQGQAFPPFRLTSSLQMPGGSRHSKGKGWKKGRN